MIVTIAILYFNSISQTIFESQKDKMRSFAASIAADVIRIHMYGGVYSLENNLEFDVALHSNKENILYGKDFPNINFNETYYEKENALYIIDQSAQMHLGVKYIVVRDQNVYLQIEELKNKVILYSFLTICMIALIGYILSKLFLRPIANEREKLDTFIKNTTHELNTPVTALLMSIGSLKENYSARALERIQISANRISHIYSDLSYLIKEELNNNQNIENINIKNIIDEQIILFEGYAKSKSINFILELEEYHFTIDIESAKRLISNLISNSLKYSNPNSSIEISLKNNLLIIKDYGIGIKEKDLQNITNRYYRANQSEGGFGIGLNIVNSICKKYNLKFTIESTYNEYTKITIDFSS